MDAPTKIQFVNDLTTAIVEEIIENIPRMPEDWDGHELRRYIADKFEEKTGGSLGRGVVRSGGNSKRMAAYRNDVIVRNL
ncbi:hypothetical protein [Bradyrhizobium sp. Tv2a-2]|uniref:hypothetical protein n=1 Tax=Bradyrhizobium sp. Tv2a-2 TaxID=113395 RepID=UPI0004044C2B|nr:hypothetical protein [Bradyrhizobium sp. Tv2a-2]